MINYLKKVFLIIIAVSFCTLLALLTRHYINKDIDIVMFVAYSLIGICFFEILEIQEQIKK